MPDPIFTSPVPNVGETAVALSPLGLAVVVVQSVFPDTPVYKIPAGAGYNTTLLPFTVMGGDGRMLFVENNQVTPIRVVGPAAGDPGVVIAAATRVMLTSNSAGNALSPSGSSAIGAPTWISTAVQVANYGASIDEIVRVDPSGGGFTVTLPAPSTANAGQSIIVKNVTDARDVVDIQTAGGTIDGAADFALAGARAVVTFVSDGTNWLIGLTKNIILPFLVASRITSDQAIAAANTDLIFNGVASIGPVGGEFNYNTATGIWTLPPGKTYALRARPYFSVFTTPAVGTISYAWVDAANTRLSPDGGFGQAVAVGYTADTTISPAGEAYFVFAPVVTTQVKLRVLALAGGPVNLAQTSIGGYASVEALA